MPKILSIILGGGKGTRLFPLTEDRAKPAVPFGGKYRLVDIPISNCINSDLRNIYVLTQFNSTSLHLHLANTYQFDTFTRGFCEILAAEQTFTHSGWYEGTADAVRKNFVHFRTQNPDYYLILSGDQLYRMDLSYFLQKHIESDADITIAAKPVPRSEADQLGILKADGNGRITDFFEKPGSDKDISDLKIQRSLIDDSLNLRSNDEYLASMGIYFFKASVMEELLNNDKTDFGKEIIPDAIKTHKVNAFIYDGFWEDIGTIKNFYETNIMLTKINPEFNFYDEFMPIYTHKRDLPASKFNSCNLSQALTADGCIITNASIVNSIIGVRTIIANGASLDGVVCMGADYYESMEQCSVNKTLGRPDVGIGQGSIVKGAIIDKNARIGSNCRIGIDSMERHDGDFGNYYIRDGIIIIPKDAELKPGTTI